ncbi:uncharacterized protein LOC142332987 [Lycorma delicatula]|uniref:uncharacterized protein LOC142332987 n=1 Tax=Lycorma delicatula TaxID=130591 RepID=UPI003F51375B
MLTKIVSLLSFLAFATAQFPSGRILEPPVPHLCAQRKLHEKFQGKGYYFSWKDQATDKQEEDWLGARNWCRTRCMDLVSLQMSNKNDYIKSHLIRDNVKYIWTSGRLCDFKGCERPDLQPPNINGWFWSSELQKLSPTTDRAQNDWSQSGGIGRPQPDNREQIQQNGPPESCLAILNNFYNDGVHWHDVSCHHRKPWVCEESESLIKYVQYTNPQLRITF